ncbi:MAG: IS30 family transposase [Verrucomicrobiales bacterium]
MKKYHHLTDEERAVIGNMLCRRLSMREIGRALGRSPSTICREIHRNEYPNHGCYLSLHAGPMARGRRRRSRLGSSYSAEQMKRVEELLKLDYSPEQISGYLKRRRELSISHETIYRHLLADKKAGGNLYQWLRSKGRKQRRKRYGAYDSRGRLAGKRPLAERPAGATNRSRVGHWEIDTVMGKNQGCVLTMVDRKTGYVMIGKLKARTIAQTNRCLRALMERHAGKFRSITADNGCEFHGYEEVEQTHGCEFYFAAPHHSWERGSNENANGLIRQYLPKGMCLNRLTQSQCDRIARKLNSRPRKRYNYRTPEELFN